MSRNKLSQRGTTIPELMTVVVILGLLMTMLVAVIGPLMRSQSQSQAKLDTVQSAVSALYRIQRDLRQTYYLGTWACTTGSAATCSQPTTFGTTSAIAFPTAYLNGSSQFQLQVGGSTPDQPNWQGVMVYWIDSTGDLKWAFDPTPTGFTVGNEHISSTVAAAAVVDATTGVVTSTTIARNLQQLVAAVNPSNTNIVSLQMQAQSTQNGNVNETTYRSDVLTRNN
jgi:type II secretory pathway pseudopilin PulG